MVIKLFLPMLTAFFMSLLATPLIIKVAHHVGAIDVPSDDRRVHTKPIPRLGGLAIFISVMFSLLIFIDLPTTKLLGIMIGSLVIVFLGFVDDIAPIKAKYKLMVQILAAFILVFSDIRITGVSSFFNLSQTIYVDEFLSTAITILWIVGITNTLNLIDGLDGLSGGVSTISALTLAYVAFINGRIEIAIITLIIAGACLGFLPYNFNPARIFMGDTGALFLGFILSAISIEGTIKSATAITFFAPVLALGLPIFDTFFSIVRRTATGKHPFEADKGHLHHRILSMGFGQKKTVLMLYLINTLLGLGGVFLLKKLYVEMGITIAIAAILILIPIRLSLKARVKVDEE
ncbi:MULTISPECIES: glycosyltransferase family 4 protein [unclassified Fusibacter]|uniref:glycosyltransferase family 4 protein n=1 Tax=unclassified Fusibacter TaxID=2624464 RepID=UPI001FAA7A0E|nr:MraY family glycosyltransferase [Fusibacter sp. A1]MCK8059871.1 undecaprenyl/decaprenyl-phosphate alpha-N-acetylglucosaminyl 1-phosphate transferase [Fusibacter sp. A2]